MTACQYTGFYERVYPELMTPDGSLHAVPGEAPRDLGYVPEDGQWVILDQLPSGKKARDKASGHLAGPGNPGDDGVAEAAGEPAADDVREA